MYDINQILWYFLTTPAGHLARRRRRATSGKYLEVKVVADHTMEAAIGSRRQTQLYIMTLMNIVSFQFESLHIVSMHF